VCEAASVAARETKGVLIQCPDPCPHERARPMLGISLEAPERCAQHSTMVVASRLLRAGCCAVSAFDGLAVCDQYRNDTTGFDPSVVQNL